MFVLPADYYNGKQLAISQDSRVVEMTVFRDLTPGDFDAPVFSLGGQDDYAFSPDGQEICYTSNHDKNPAASTNNDLWIVSVNGGVAKNITADNPASDSTPLYSPDGKYIAYRAQKRPGDESDRFRLMLYDRKTGSKKVMTDKLDAWVGTFAWSPDSKRLYFVFESDGKALVDSFAVDRPYNRSIMVDGDGGKDPSNFEFVVRDGYNDDLVPTSDGKTLLHTRMSVNFPNEIYRQTLGQAWSERLTHLNDAVLSGVEMSPVEPFEFTGAHKDKVTGFLVKPPNFDPSRKYPGQ